MTQGFENNEEHVRCKHCLRNFPKSIQNWQTIGSKLACTSFEVSQKPPSSLPKVCPKLAWSWSKFGPKLDQIQS